MNMLLRERGSKPKRANWVNVFSLLLATCALGIAIDVYGLVRLDSFEHTAHEAGHASGVLWVVPRRKHGEVLHLNGKDVGYELSCNTPGWVDLTHASMTEDCVQESLRTLTGWLGVCAAEPDYGVGPIGVGARGE